MDKAFCILDNLIVSYYYGGIAVIDENKETMLENDIFPTPATSLFTKCYYVTKGSYTAYIDNHKHEIKAGDMLLIPSGVQFNFGKELKVFKQYWIHFNLSIQEPNYSQMNNLLAYVDTNYIIHVGNSGKLVSQFQSIFSNSKLNYIINQFNLRTSIMNLVSFFFDHSLINDKKNPKSVVYNVTNYINEHIQENIKLKELAAIAHMEQCYFIRYFKKITGLSPMQYTINKKFEIVRGLLDHTEQSVKEIMIKVGFYDASSFSRAFKKYSGFTPTEYKNNNILSKKSNILNNSKPRQ